MDAMLGITRTDDEIAELRKKAKRRRKDDDKPAE
jgi:hypothetical protein